MPPMATEPFVQILSVEDPRVAPYRHLKDRDLAQDGGRFIAEGEFVVRRLLVSNYPVESVLLATRRVEEIAPLVPEGVAVYVADSSVVNGILGYRFHAGIMAVGKRKPAVRLDDVAPLWGERVTVVIAPDVANAENMGALIRVSAAFGVNALVLGPQSCDPFYRQSIRVSMGTIFHLPIIESADLLHDLYELREVWGMDLAATVLAEGAEELASARRPARLGLLFGNEAQGLGAEIVAACNRRITIPMRLGTDSLNVAVSAGIILYHFTQLQK